MSLTLGTYIFISVLFLENTYELGYISKADYSVFIYQWGNLDLKVARVMTAKSRQAGLKAILGLSPTTLDQGRKELDLPAEVRRRAGATISFANPVIRKAYVDTVKQLAHLRPAYLCLATEINFLALQRLEEYLYFVTLYKEAYREAKRISPETWVFVSFQWEWMRIVDAKEPHKIKEHSKVIDIFRPELDVIGLTSYPSPFHGSPAELPHDYYSWLSHHVRKNDEILFMEPMLSSFAYCILWNGRIDDILLIVNAYSCRC